MGCDREWTVMLREWTGMTFGDVALEIGGAVSVKGLLSAGRDGRAQSVFVHAACGAGRYFADLRADEAGGCVNVVFVELGEVGDGDINVGRECFPAFVVARGATARTPTQKEFQLKWQFAYQGFRTR